LERIGITRAAWLVLAEDFETTFCSWIGRAKHAERGLRARGPALGARHPRLLAAVSQLSGLSTLAETR